VPEVTSFQPVCQIRAMASTSPGVALRTERNRQTGVVLVGMVGWFWR
jgi:hypothetical protein